MELHVLQKYKIAGLTSTVFTTDNKLHKIPMRSVRYFHAEVGQ